MALSFLIIDTYYPQFLETFHSSHLELDGADYRTALQQLMGECFGTSDFYSTNLRRLGHEAIDLVANDRRLQEKWAVEHGIPVRTLSQAHKVLRRIPHVRRFIKDVPSLFPILEAQVKAVRPDIIYFQDLNLCEPEFLERVRPYVKLVVGQIACPLPEARLLRGCDLILTSFPHYVQRFRAMGLASEYFRIGFESTILERLRNVGSQYDTVFVGGVSHLHVRGNDTLEKIAAEIDLDVWGYGIEQLPADSPLRRRYHGQAWGIHMYDILRRSRIVLNRHGEVAEGFANNMRLFEATGVGALLLTDEGENLGDLFDIASEVMTYSDPADLADKIRYCLAHEKERAAIAVAGQARTLRDHTYAIRMKELETILEPYLQKR